jgi:hypothetical protein
LALKLPQCPQLVASERVNGRLAVLGPTHMQRGSAAKFHLQPFERLLPELLLISDGAFIANPSYIISQISANRERRNWSPLAENSV